MLASEVLMDQTPVAELVDAARRGDQGAWDALVDRFLPLVDSVARRYRMAHADVEDVEGEVWRRLVEHLDDIREPRALPGWIVTTTSRVCLHVLRGSGHVSPLDPLSSSPLDVGADPGMVDDDLLREERHHALREALLELPADRRELLVLLLRDPPVPYSEISQRLGIPEGSIGPTRRRALDQLRRTAAFRAFFAEELAVEPRR
jgi:RNA polymerase sigma factor (sigma-70 family)